MLSACRWRLCRGSGRRRSRWRSGCGWCWPARKRTGSRRWLKVAARTGLSRESVRKWRVRFMERRLDGLGDAPRPGAARTITDEQVEVLVTRTLTEKGRGQDSHWSTRSMAAETGLSQSSVSRIWRAFGLKPQLRNPQDARDPPVAAEAPPVPPALHPPRAPAG